MKIKFVKNPNTGHVVNQFANSESFGYCLLEATDIAFNGNRLNTVRKTCLLRGDVNELQAVVDSNPNGLDGRIRFVELTESDAKDALDNGATTEAQKVFLSEVHKELAKTDWNKAIEGFKLQNPSTGEFSTNGGSHILRVKVYDPTGSLADITLPRDSWNVAEQNLHTADVE
jgi:hypothetical protein